MEQSGGEGQPFLLAPPTLWGWQGWPGKEGGTAWSAARGQGRKEAESEWLVSQLLPQGVGFFCVRGDILEQGVQTGRTG